MTYDSLALSTEGPIASLELRREAQNNAFDEGLHRELSLALLELRRAPDVRVVLLHSAGRMFSAGGALEYIERLRDDPALARRTQQEGHDTFTALVEMPVPIVVAIQGHAIGFGATIATACDVTVAWKGAKIGDPHVQIGLVAGDGGVLSWTAAVGYNRARRMLMTGDTLTAEQAYQFGLVTDLVETPEAALPEARRIAERIAALPPVAVQGTKRAFIALARQANASVLDVALHAEVACLSTEDLTEAVKAARERRTGQYRNR
jgi:enoyl-CoA hydratase